MPTSPGWRFVHPPPQVEQLQLLMTRRMQLLGMRTAEKNRLASAGRVLHKSITTVIKTLDKEIAKLERDIDAHVERHFKEQAQRFQDVNGLAR